MKRIMIIAAALALGSIIALAGGKKPTPAYMHFDSDGTNPTVKCGTTHARHGLDYLVGTCN
jgi:hypothetical protein